MLKTLCVMHVNVQNLKKISYHVVNNKCQIPFQMINCDVWGTSPYTDLCGFRWFLIYVDDCSRFNWICQIVRTPPILHPDLQKYFK